MWGQDCRRAPPRSAWWQARPLIRPSIQWPIRTRPDPTTVWAALQRERHGTTGIDLIEHHHTSDALFVAGEGEPSIGGRLRWRLNGEDVEARRARPLDPPFPERLGDA